MSAAKAAGRAAETKAGRVTGAGARKEAANADGQSRSSARGAAPAPRRPGRPPRAASASADRRSDAAVAPLLSRETILARATELARKEALAELSMVGLAREFGVTPALIHYYVGSRDDLVSGVVNRYFRERVARFGESSGDWRRDLERIARVTYAMSIEYGGVMKYIFSHNRYRLFQKTAPGETDHGLEFFDHFARVFKAGGFTPKEGALGYHLLLQFVLASAYATVGRQLPAEHEDFVREHLTAGPKERYPGAHHLAKPFSKLDADTAFETGLALLLDGFAGWKQARERR